MDKVEIVTLLQNSGIRKIEISDTLVKFEDPACIFPAFDTILNYAWIVILVLTAFMLLGWAILYIKNGTNINNVFNNAKTLILIFCVLSVVKPAVNIVYGEDLFAKGCLTRQVELSEIQKLLDMRNEKFKQSDEAKLYESFNIVDSGPIYTEMFDNINDDNSYDKEYDALQENSSYTENANQYNSVFDSIDGTYNPNQTLIISAAYDKNSDSVIYVTADGTKVKRTNGTTAWRNNNPGNIIDSKFARNAGAIGSTGKFAIFPDEATGMRAVTQLLKSKNYKNLSIKDAIHKWAPAADNNNPAQYTKKVEKMTGLSADIPLNSLNDTELQSVANAIRKIEGWVPGKETRI